MGLFKRAASAVNQFDPATDLTIALSPSIRRAQKLEARGTPANGVITGVKFSLNDETTRKEFAVTVVDTGVRFGIRTQPPDAHRLRLGLPVVIKLDDGRAILDWAAMAAAWGLDDDFLAQDALRKPPADGLVDTALDARVQRHLKKWSPVSAGIVSLTRKNVLGMPTLNWDVELELADGSRALSKNDEVPSYAQWWAAPGTVVPAVVDPGDTSKASIDWPKFALTKFEEVGFDDDVVPGSIAAVLEQPVPTSPAMTAQPAAADPSAPVTLDMTMRSWVDMRRNGQMSDRDFEKTLRDWQDAGMCTPAQSDAARAAAREGSPRVGVIVGGRQPADAVIAATSLASSSMDAASTFSSRCATDPVPGIGTMTGERASIHASTTCVTVTP